MNTLRLQAENSAKAFYQRRQNETVEALAGDGVGNMDVAGRLQWIYVRMAGDATKVSQAYNRSGFTFAENDSIALRWVKRTGMGFYQVDGYSGSAVYDVFGFGSGDGTGTGVAKHAWQHERMDAGQGGFDPLDIFARMVVPLRARPQTVPNDTLYVEAGLNPLTGNWWAGGNSASFFPVPGTPGQARIDLLYLGTDDALHIVAGTPVGGGVTPTLPAIVVPSVPLAFVYLASAQAAIVEGNVYLDPGILRSPVGAVTTPTVPAAPDKAVQYDNAGAFGAVPLNATATNKFLRQVSSGTPSFEQVAYADVSGTPTPLTATQLGQILISLDAATFTAKMPVTDAAAGWLVDGMTGHLMVS